MLDFEKTNAALFDFLDGSPVPFFAVRNMKEALRSAGFSELREGDPWTLAPGGAYFVSRNDSALIAFRIPQEAYVGFQIMATHCDSPVFKIKTNAEILVENKYVRLNVEKYGGMLCAPWMDRPLSVAGRVVVETEGGGPDGPASMIETRLVNIERDLLIIPSLAIHMNREANEGFRWNAQTDLLPLFAQAGPPPGASAAPRDVELAAAPADAGSAPKGRRLSAGRAGLAGDHESVPGRFLALIAREAGVRPDQILDADLYLYSRMPAAYVGLDREFIASGRLDDLQCAFASLQGILDAEPVRSVAVHCVFDNEEVGSGTRQGAGSTFLRDVLGRINASMGRSEEDHLRALASSFMVSADNAHSIHPNHPEKADPTNRPCMNRGIVIKYSANQKYTTDGISSALFAEICRRAGVPCQHFANRSDILGGGTLGNISNSHVSMNTVDIGLAQLAMHSAYETAGVHDIPYMTEALKTFFELPVDIREGKIRID